MQFAGAFFFTRSAALVASRLLVLTCHMYVCFLCTGVKRLQKCVPRSEKYERWYRSANNNNNNNRYITE